MGVLKSECVFIIILFSLLLIPGFINIVSGEECLTGCGPTEFCGDQVCNGNENCSTCSQDCGVCPETNPNPNSSCSENQLPSCSCGTCGGCKTCETCGGNEKEDCQKHEEDSDSGCHEEKSGSRCNHDEHDDHYEYDEHHKEKEILGSYYFTEICEPNWACSQWSGECVDGFITRKCIDKNGCNDNLGKPYEYIQCEKETVTSTNVERISKNVDNTSNNLNTTFVNMNYFWLWFVIGLVVLVFLLIIVVLLR
jgi:hypothetical protein